MFGHSMACPAEAAASFTTARGENVLWPERLSSSTTSELPPVPLLDEEEDEELLLEVELELEELEPVLPELEDELELDEDELLLEDELELLLVVPLPTQEGAIKLPSWLP